MTQLGKTLRFLAVAACLTACTNSNTITGDYEIIPLPQQVALETGQPFTLNNTTKITYPDGNDVLKQNAGFLASYLQQATGQEFPVGGGAPASGCINLLLNDSIDAPEGYRLTVNADRILIEGGTEAGVFYGIQTLRKSIPARAEGKTVALPAGRIDDAPRFSYRGMMLDVARHFFPVDSVKRLIDILALHNMNTLHWHLSDDQGWRIEIKKYPKLTEIGSQRSETVIGRNSGRYDGQPYGGFYTQDEIRDVIDYAARRFVTIVPEIDLPGHQQAALAAYPELGCTGGPYEVWKQWGISEDVMCAGNEKSMQFLEDVLGEVIDLFPSEYIHIGGDECPKTRWESCPKCQARIRALGIRGDKQHTAEQYLQSYVIARMEKFVESKGRHIIGWDEILEGGLAPNATVMSWRGIAGGIEAARQQHRVIMTPNTYLYFDYYQTADTEHEPLAIGGYVPLENVYGFEPQPKALTDEQKKYIIGVQANIWTEYIPTFSQYEYMAMPRMAALSEIQWSSPEKKDYENFLARLIPLTRMYDRSGYNYGKHIFDVRADLTPDTARGSLNVSLGTLGGGTIHYTLDGSEPSEKSPVYRSPLQIRENATVQAIAIRPEGKSRIFSEQIHINKATLKPLTLQTPPSPGYQFKGAPVLNDGLRGNTNYRTGHWLGFQGRDLDARIDLRQPTEISRVNFTANVVKGDWIMGPVEIIVKGSDDGTTFRTIASRTVETLKQSDPDGLYPHELAFDPVKTRYVQIIVRSDRLPDWHGGAGHPAFLFVDEIGID